MNSLAFTFIAEARGMFQARVSVILASHVDAAPKRCSSSQVGSFFNEPLVSRMAATSVQALFSADARLRSVKAFVCRVCRQTMTRSSTCIPSCAVALW